MISDAEVEALVVDNLELVAEVVWGTLSRGVPTYIEADDLIQECAMRLPDAIRNYRGEAGASLKTYLKTAIRRDVMDAIGHERREPIHGKRSGDDVVVGIEAAVGGWESAVEEDAYAEPLEYEARNVRLSPGLTQTVKTLPAVR